MVKVVVGGLISEGMQAMSDGKGVEGVSFWGVDDFPYSTVHILGGGLDMGQDSCVQSPGNPDPCQV